MGICDDGPYILIAKRLAATGHIAYNSGANAIIGWQLYLGAAFIKLFGFSYTTARMSTLLVAVVMAFLLQRTFVRTGIGERNATLGTLALILSPLYLVLSVTFMSDISGLFAIVICLYSCLRAVQASSDRAAIAWLWFAAITNAICGTSRQIAWLGVLVLVPCTLWLLRSRRRVLLGGAAGAGAGYLIMFLCMQWFKRQPYTSATPLVVGHFHVVMALRQLFYLLLEIPLFLLPIMALFLPELRKSRLRTIVVLSALLFGYLLIAVPMRDTHPFLHLEPTAGMPGSWVGVHGVFEGIGLHSFPPVFLHTKGQIVLTALALGSLLAAIAVVFRGGKILPSAEPAADLTWTQLGVLLGPFALANCVLLVAAAGTIPSLYDRYVMGLLAPVLICLIRFYQERVRTRLPMTASVLLIGAMAIVSIAITHNTFALYRARVDLAEEMRAAGVPDTAIDAGWEHNYDVELQYADHLNEQRYLPVAPLPSDSCSMLWYERTPHIRPIYGVGFTPYDCYGQAPFAPVHFSRWLAREPGTIYAVRYLPPAKP
jgi:hypothetical protein